MGRVTLTQRCFASLLPPAAVGGCSQLLYWAGLWLRQPAGTKEFLLPGLMLQATAEGGCARLHCWAGLWLTPTGRH
jgi:hypothetical protein